MADDKWIKDEVKRARDRASKLPRGARPVVTRPVVASRAEKRATPPTDADAARRRHSS